MAGIYLRKGSWRVMWHADGRRKSRTFATEREARAFAAGLPPKRQGKPRTRAALIDHLSANFEVDDDGCWVWVGPLSREGYARVNWKPLNKAIHYGHRVVLAAIGDTVPDDLVVDHLCRNRACINPDHLDVVTQRENVMRSPIAPGALNAAKTHCSNDHEYTPENTYRYYGLGGRKAWTRSCKTCLRDQRQRKRAAKENAETRAEVSA